MNTATTPKMTVRPLIAEIAKRAGVTQATARTVYDALLETIQDNASAGIRTELTGFGAFAPQLHKGHAVRFGGGRKDDYTVLKFSATRDTNERIAPQTPDEQPTAA